MKRYMLVLLTFFILSMTASAQNNVMWDDTSSNSWNSKFEEVNIPSSKDGSLQKDFIYRSQKSVSQPLIVSLHTWSDIPHWAARFSIRFLCDSLTRNDMVERRRPPFSLGLFIGSYKLVMRFL